MVAMSVWEIITTGFGWDLTRVRLLNHTFHIPSFICSCGWVVFAAVACLALILFVKDFFTNEEYNAFISKAKFIGDVGVLEEELAGMPKSTLTKGGDLRYNNRLFFYQNGSTIVLARMKDITAVNEQKTESVRHRTRYCVRVRIGLQTVDIETKKSNMAALKEDILEKRRQA